MTFRMEIAELEKMWDEFTDIPTNLDDEIEVDFISGKKELIVSISGIGLINNCRMD